MGPGAGIWRNNVRVQVEMDTSCPLVPGFPLERNQLPDLWVPFKYEKLGNFALGVVYWVMTKGIVRIVAPNGL